MTISAELRKKAHDITDQRIKEYDNLVKLFGDRSIKMDMDSIRFNEKRLNQLAELLGLDELEV